MIHTTGEINYSFDKQPRAKYHANDTSGDVLYLNPQTVPIKDRRGDPAKLDTDGFCLAPHVSAVADFHNRQDVVDIYSDEMQQVFQSVSGADHVVVTSPGILRFGEKSKNSGALDNSRPARFVHVDISETTAHQFAQNSAPQGKKIKRFMHLNGWRVISKPPQDIPLTVCRVPSVADKDLITADAIFDPVDGKGEAWSFEGLVIGHNPEHEWNYFSGMTRDEVLIFKTYDSRDGACVPHSAFNHPEFADVPHTRASVEIRGIAYWFEE